jgi:hypothetical protein
MALGATKAQCGSYFAPCLIHSRSSSRSLGESESFDSGGGITSSGSFELMRATSSLPSGSPGRSAP